uniref:DAO domain-containing protein n=1 Tax=Panagrellus redivivus TaxID=6233 RepID=A0A7E4V774_PANRE
MSSLKVAIVGQGVSGVTSAYAILEALPGASVVVFGDRPFEDITSYGPAGFIVCLEAGHKHWTKVSFDKFAEIERKFGPKSGVKYVSGYEQSDDEAFLKLMEDFNGSTVHNFQWMGKRQLSQLVDDPAPFAISYSSYATEGRVYVPWLRQRAEALGAVFVRREITNLAALGDEGFNVVINAAGLAGGRLAGDDDTCYPLRGVGFEIAAPGFKHFSFRDLTMFIIPIDNAILVGTVRQPGRWDRAVTEADRREVFHTLYKAHPNLKGLPVVREWCGLRPGRPTVRVERQSLKTPKGADVEIIHNYGHSSNGFTLSWGCASDVVSHVLKVYEDTGLDRSKI